MTESLFLAIRREEADLCALYADKPLAHSNGEPALRAFA